MKNLSSIILSRKIAVVFGMAVIALSSLSFIFIQRQVGPNSEKGLAVVELFTSQGCSSCPPAEELVAKIQKESHDHPVYILTYHVDYWNRLGWKDVFSSPAYAKRQYQYSGWLKLNGVYTPQVVVNGRREFVGSREGTLRQAIKTELQTSFKDELQLRQVKLNQRQVDVQYQTGAASPRDSLVLTLVQKAATTRVKSGENKGRTIAHVQIVRHLQTISLQGKNSGSVTIALPAGLSSEGLELIAFLQNSTNGEITAAAKSAILVADSSTQANVSAR